MTLQQLRYFLAAAEHGSFSAAAESLLMAQPTLSDQIRRLEGDLGGPLRGVLLSGVDCRRRRQLRFEPVANLTQQCHLVLCFSKSRQTAIERFQHRIVRAGAPAGDTVLDD